MACFSRFFGLFKSSVSNVFGRKGGRVEVPHHVLDYHGAYYEVLDMADTQALDRYLLPHEITEDMLGKSLGTGLYDIGEEKMELWQYRPYADITVTEPNGDQRHQRAVYVVLTENGYSFAIFCNYYRFDSNTHQEAKELFAVYGIDAAEDIRSIRIGDETVEDTAKIQEVFDLLWSSTSFGNNDYQELVFGGMSEASQQEFSLELADTMVPLRITTAWGLVTGELQYYPTIDYLSWALNYYQLDSPILP